MQHWFKFIENFTQKSKKKQPKSLFEFQSAEQFKLCYKNKKIFSEILTNNYWINNEKISEQLINSNEQLRFIYDH